MSGSPDTLAPEQVENAFETLGKLASKGISSSTSTPLPNDSAPALTPPDETQPVSQPRPDGAAAAANLGLNATDGKDAADIQAASTLESTPESAPSTMYNIDGEPGVDAADVKEEDKKFKYKDLGEVNAERQTKEMDPLPELKSGGRRRSRRRNYKKSAKKSAKRGGRKSAKKGGKKHRKSAKKGGKKRSYRKH
jgi:hypothetical protein